MSFLIRKGAFQKAHSRSNHATCVRAMVETSRMDIFGKRDSSGWIWVLIRIHGTAATLPSTTNNRILTVPRQHLLKQLSAMLANPAYRTYVVIKKLINDVRVLRGFLTKNPEQQQKLEALTHLYQALTKDKPIAFETESKKRALVTMMLSPDLNRYDSHNIPKAFCDWMQEQKIISNDKHVDAFARRKTDHGMKGQSSDILIMRYPEANVSVNSMLQPMIDIIFDVEPRKA